METKSGAKERHGWVNLEGKCVRNQHVSKSVSHRCLPFTSLSSSRFIVQTEQLSTRTLLQNQLKEQPSAFLLNCFHHRPARFEGLALCIYESKNKTFTALGVGRWSHNCFCLEVPTFRTIRQKGVKTTAVKRFAQINIREAWARRPGYSDRRHNICLWAFQICALKINRAESPNIQRKYFHKIVLKIFFYLAGMFVHAAEQQRRSDAACEACSASTLPELWLILWASQRFCRINSDHCFDTVKKSGHWCSSCFVSSYAAIWSTEMILLD